MGAQPRLNSRPDPDSDLLAALLPQQRFDALDVELDAEHVGVHIQRFPEPGERILVALELEVDLPESRERAEVARVAVQYLVAVGDGSLVVAGKVVRRGALVPA